MLSNLRYVAAAAFGATGGAVGVFAALSTERGAAWVTDRVDAARLKVYMAGTRRPKRIILVRHGQGGGYAHTSGTDENGHIHCSEIPAMRRPLTSTGRKQSLTAGVRLRELVANESVRFYVSPWTTCRQSFEFLGGSFDITRCHYVDEPRIRNQDFGDHESNKMLELRKAAKLNPFYYRYPSGESGADVYDRLSAFLESMHREWQMPSRADNYVLVSHNSVLQLFLCRWFHWAPATYKTLPRWPGGGMLVMEQGKDGRYAIIQHPYTDKQIAALPSRARKSFAFNNKK